MNMENLENENVLEKYGRDITKNAQDGKTDPVIGRDEEIRSITRILSRKTKNNPVLIGEAGVGKTAIVEGIAYKIQRNDIPDALKGYKIYRVNTTALLGEDNGENRVLKLVNSSYYGFPKQISTIHQAIIILGFTTVKGVILSASIFKMFTPKGNQTFDYKNFWKHSLLTATAARMISKKTTLNTQEDIFSAAFLHDIGKIIFAQYDWENYSNVCKYEYETDNELLQKEEQECGLNHCEIANMVAYSWNLPEIFCDIITYHHNPNASEKYKKECFVVYVANVIVSAIMSNKNLNIDNIPLDILENLNISGDNIIEIHEELVNIAKDINDINSFFE